MIAVTEVQVLGRYAKPAAGGFSIAFDGVNIWAATGSDSVTKFRSTNGVVVGTFYVGPGVGKIAFDGTNLWINYIKDANRAAADALQKEIDARD